LAGRIPGRRHGGAVFDSSAADSDSDEPFMVPKRIQRKLSKGWKVPPDTVYVGTGSKWSNPFRKGISRNVDGSPMTAADTVKSYRKEAPLLFKFNILDLAELRGRNLMCWCAVGRPCHADVLPELANTTDAEDR
jgi:hypothetical protein